ncbi:MULTISPECIES: WD40/YVTN/BNR-like repeat-containing protein [Niastella]|uniref:Photosynthesis system II assembly factor Ycf48/Hcf136-like domain-containing protein n=1 Tax=Niastella soli TaxID=2821487 RepID=A0ABS3YN72_9BACT|nr:hypothetical protein [Niastella soli]MBO9199322.1 hypothetical protein [Niastella soli]
MKPPVLPLLIACLFQSGVSFAQTTDKALLHFESAGLSMGVSKQEQVMVGTKVGEVAITDSVKGFWRTANVNPVSESSLSGVSIENVCYFNADTAFVSGFIKNKDKYNIIYHTIDGGKHWKPIDFGMDGWVDDAACLDNGEAWLSVSGKGIAYTKDHGFTWNSLSFPYPRERFAKIYFNNKHEGIIGSLWNVLAYTPDNCNSWTTLPTPLNQKKYNKTAPQRRPEFDRVAIFKDYLLVSQEDLVFYSRKDSVNWVFMPGYTDFYTDAENNALYFKTSKGGFIKSDDHLQPISSFKNIGNPCAASCKNGSLFILNLMNILQINTKGEVIESPLYTNNLAEIEPTLFHYSASGNLGSIGNKIYRQKEYKGQWNYAFTLPFTCDSGHLSMTDTGTILFSRKDDSLFYYSLADAKVEKRAKAEVLKNFCAKEIQTIVFSKGSQGCFHYVSDKMEYVLEGGSFVLSQKSNPQKGQTVYLKDNADEIDQEAVQSFVKKIPAIYHDLITINDLKFTQNEYDACKRNILTFKTFLESNQGKKKVDREEKEGTFTFYVNNLDFNKLIALVDSVKTIDQAVLYNYFMFSGLWSTTSLWARVLLVNADNEVLEIKSTFYKPAAFYFPWVISVNGTTSATMSIEINKFLYSVFPGFLDAGKRVDIIQDLVKELYRQEE